MEQGDKDNKLITNNSTANNRKGEISFNADKLDPNKKYYFQTQGGKELYVKIETTGTAPNVVKKAYIEKTDAAGNIIKVYVDDILNGRAAMPE